MILVGAHHDLSIKDDFEAGIPPVSWLQAARSFQRDVPAQTRPGSAFAQTPSPTAMMISILFVFVFVFVFVFAFLFVFVLVFVFAGREAERQRQREGGPCQPWPGDNTNQPSNS